MSNRVVKNASWIIICKIIQSLVGLVVSMLCARYLGPSGYGAISYAASLVAFILPLMQLGLRSTLVREIVDEGEGEGVILGTALILNLISSVVCIIGINAFTLIANAGERETLVVVSLYSTSLLFQAFEILQLWFQAKLLSKYTSVVSLIAYLIMSAYRIFLLATDKSIYWFSLSQSIDYLLIAIATIILYKKLSVSRLRFSPSCAAAMLRRSSPYILSAMMVSVFQQTDRLMLKNMLGDAATGYYSAAVTVAGITSFVFAAMIDSARPSILEGKRSGSDSFERNVSRLYSVIFYLSLVQCIVMTALAPLLIRIMYGEEYAPAAEALRLVVWYTTYSYFGSVRNIWILAEGKQKYLWLINLSGAAANVTLNLVLIPCMGIVGAALASLITQIFTNVVVGFIIPAIRRNNLLMIKGLNPKHIFDVIRLAGR